MEPFLTEGEFKEIREAFNVFDSNNSGYIESYELRGVLQAMGQNPTQKEVDSIMQEADVIVRDGKIDFDEFARMMKNYVFKTSTDVDKELVAAFQVFDRDKNGYISRQELEYVLKSIGEQLTSEEINELFRCADANEDGKISYNEFIVLFNQQSQSTSKTEERESS